MVKIGQSGAQTDHFHTPKIIFVVVVVVDQRSDKVLMQSQFL